MKRKSFCLMAMVVVLGLGTTAKADLIDRGSFAYNDGAGHTGNVNLIYDDDFDITWVGDGNFAQTTTYDADGRMKWSEALGWAQNLKIGDYTDWLLPHAYNQDGSGPDAGINVTGSPMGHLFYVELGGVGDLPISRSGHPDLGYFPNLQDANYWTWSFVTPPSPNLSVWYFDYGSGAQSVRPSDQEEFFSLAVRSGDVVAAVTVPP